MLKIPLLKGGFLINALDLVKSVLSQAADGAYPIFGDIFPGSTRGDAVVGIALSGIVNITTRTFVLHNCYLLIIMNLKLYDILKLCMLFDRSRKRSHFRCIAYEYYT